VREVSTQQRYRFALQTAQAIDAQMPQPSQAQRQLQITDTQGRRTLLSLSRLDRTLAAEVDRRLLLAALETLRHATVPTIRDVIAVDVLPASSCAGSAPMPSIMKACPASRGSRKACTSKRSQTVSRRPQRTHCCVGWVSI